jgi:hypothetical protein
VTSARDMLRTQSEREHRRVTSIVLVVVAIWEMISLRPRPASEQIG